MSTFYGGEQISQVVSISGTTTTSAQRVITLYTVPAGFYGVLKWFYMGRNDYQYLAGGNSFSQSYAVSASQSLSYNLIPNQGLLLCDGDAWKTQKIKFNAAGALKDLYLTPGDKIVSTEGAGGQPVKWEGELHLYKKP